MQVPACQVNVFPAPSERCFSKQTVRYPRHLRPPWLYWSVSLCSVSFCYFSSFHDSCKQEIQPEYHNTCLRNARTGTSGLPNLSLSFRVSHAIIRLILPIIYSDCNNRSIAFGICQRKTRQQQPAYFRWTWCKMDQRPDLPEKMRDEHSGNEWISCPLSSGREHDHETEGNAFQKAGNTFTWQAGTCMIRLY